MPVTFQLVDVTRDQKARIYDAFVATQGPLPEGMTQEQFFNDRMLHFVKSVMKGADAAKAKQDELDVSTVEEQFPER